MGETRGPQEPKEGQWRQRREQHVQRPGGEEDGPGPGPRKEQGGPFSRSEARKQGAQARFRKGNWGSARTRLRRHRGAGQREAARLVAGLTVSSPPPTSHEHGGFPRERCRDVGEPSSVLRLNPPLWGQRCRQTLEPPGCGVSSTPSLPHPYPLPFYPPPSETVPVH